MTSALRNPDLPKSGLDTETLLLCSRLHLVHRVDPGGAVIRGALDAHSGHHVRDVRAQALRSYLQHCHVSYFRSRCLF